MPEPRIAVAISGGGHRASAFGLGALLYLARAERAGAIASVASVSGGSLANAAVAQDLDLSTCSTKELEATVARVARRMSGMGTVFAAPVTWLYLIVLAGAAAATVYGPWQLPTSDVVRILAFVGGLLVLGALVGLRGLVCARAFRRTLYRGGGNLADIHGEVEHVICATDLHAGEHVYFSRAFVYAYRFGLGKPGDLGLHRAVQASAAFPGVFPVSWMRSSRFDFQDGRPEGRTAWFLALHDGGVYDNMADQWARGLDTRNERVGSAFKAADQLIVVNASAGLPWKSMWRLSIPWLGELFALLQDKSVLYDNGNSLRRQELVARFDLAERDGAGLRGALVHISQSPFTVPDYFAKQAARWPDRATRSEAARRHLLSEGSEQEWQAVASANASVATTLLGLKRAVVARLIRHAYVLAMINLHVILDYPLGPIPTEAEIAALVEKS